MSDLSDKDIDHLFREGAGRYDFQDNPEAWEQMEQLLERDRRRRLLWWVLAGLLAILLLGTAWWLWPEKTSENESDRPAAVLSAPPPSTGGGPPDEKSSLEALSGSGDSDVLPVEIPTKSEKGSGQEAVSSSATDEKEEKKAAGNDRPPALILLPAAPTEELNDEPAQETPRSTPVDKGAPSRPPMPFTPSLPVAEISIAAPGGPAPLPAFAYDSTVEKRSPAANAWVIGLQVTPELASVGWGNEQSFSYKGGLTVDYRYGRHFSIGTGLLLSRKRYSAGPGEYTPPGGFGNYQPAPDETYGWCTMLEIPLNVGYFPGHHRADGFYLELGISSFLMLRERYYYHYEQQDPDLIRWWNSRWDNHAWLGLLNVSPGYQWRLGPRSGLQLSPYLQIPLSGVGYGSVDLYSVGLNLRFGWWMK